MNPDDVAKAIVAKYIYGRPAGAFAGITAAIAGALRDAVDDGPRKVLGAPLTASEYDLVKAAIAGEVKAIQEMARVSGNPVLGKTNSEWLLEYTEFLLTCNRDLMEEQTQYERGVIDGMKLIRDLFLRWSGLSVAEFRTKYGGRSDDWDTQMRVIIERR